MDARFAAGAKQVVELPPPVGVEFAFAGRSNVGKSSLLNRMMGRRALARTSSTPGCTRAIQFYEVRLRDGVQLTLVDLPGYGYAQRSKEERKVWAELIETYLLKRATLTGVAVLVDARRGVEHEESELFKMLAEPSQSRRPLTTVLVGTKLDKVPRPKQQSAIAALRQPNTTAVGFSTELPESTHELWRQIRRAIAL